jgi:hypothetical protein
MVIFFSIFKHQKNEAKEFMDIKINARTFGGRQQAIVAFKKMAPTEFDVEEGGPENLQNHNGPFTVCFEEDDRTPHKREDGTTYTVGGWSQWYIKDKGGRTCWKRKNFERGSV